MEHKHSESSFGIEGVIDTTLHDVSELRDECSNWDSLSEEEKLRVSRTVDPTETTRFYNVTTEELHKYFVRNLNAVNDDVDANIDASIFALGNDGASGTSVTDTDLNNRVFNKTVTDHAENGTDLLASTFVDSGEANGYDLSELGLFSGDPANRANSDVFLINHTSFSSITKDNSKTITFDVTLSFSDV